MGGTPLINIERCYFYFHTWTHKNYRLCSKYKRLRWLQL